MTRRQAVELTRRVLAHFEHDTLDVAEDVWIESSRAFVDAERHAAEQQMLRDTPHVVGWAGEVGVPGDYTTKDVMGVPVLIVRGKDQRLRAFLNACVHRGAQVAQGCGNARRFVCPYHAWSYHMDGRLANAPARNMFSGAGLEGRGLMPLPVNERAGLITVGLHADVDTDPGLDDVADALSEYNFAHYRHFETRRFDLRANWKLVVDVNFEGYHFPYVHGKTLAAFVTNNSVCDTFGHHVRWAFPFRDIVQYRDAAESDWPNQFFGTVVYGIFPSCVLIESPGSTQMLRIYPGDAPNRSVVYLTYGSPTEIETDQDRQWLSDGMEAACTVLRDEDFPAAESCQRGLDAGLDHVVFGRNEPLLHHLAASWQERLLNTTCSRSSEKVHVPTRQSEWP